WWLSRAPSFSEAGVRTLRSEAGFSMMELMIATGLLLVVSAITTNALMQMGKQQQSIWNRTEMHSGIRGATELLQQEVGQAGRVSTPNTMTLVDGIPLGTSCTPATPTLNAVTTKVTSVSGLFATGGLTPSWVMLT